MVHKYLEVRDSAVLDKISVKDIQYYMKTRLNDFSRHKIQSQSS